MKSSLKQLLALTTGSLLAGSAFAIIDFEFQGTFFGDGASVPLDLSFLDGNAAVRFGMGTRNTFVRSSSVFFEQTGGPSSPAGFWYDSTDPVSYDTEAPKIGGLYPNAADAFNGSIGLQDYFVRAQSVGGGNPFQNNWFIIEYLGDFLPTEASGEVWDIDGNPIVGSEEYTVRAYGEAGNLLQTVVSPEYFNNSDLTSLDGQPWQFVVSSTDEDPIRYITIDFTGTKTSNIGLAFDNFSADTIFVPEPSAFALLFGGLAFCLVGLRRRR